LKPDRAITADLLGYSHHVSPLAVVWFIFGEEDVWDLGTFNTIVVSY
jgi:hypothetical protein